MIDTFTSGNKRFYKYLISCYYPTNILFKSNIVEYYSKLSEHIWKYLEINSVHFFKYFFQGAQNLQDPNDESRKWLLARNSCKKRSFLQRIVPAKVVISAKNSLGSRYVLKRHVICFSAFQISLEDVFTWNNLIS